MEYVFVVAGSDGDSGPKPEIFNLGCPTFQCDKIDKVPGGGLNRVASAGGMIGDTPILCGGHHPEDDIIFKTCFKFIKKNGGYKWVKGDNALSIARYIPSYGSIVIEDQLLVSGGVIKKVAHFLYYKNLYLWMGSLQAQYCNFQLIMDSAWSKSMKHLSW